MIMTHQRLIAISDRDQRHHLGQAT